jgi:thiol-disulfide isomerase/thioredoxin
VYAMPLQNHLGEKFNIDNFIDSNGIITKLNFTQSEITIIDFWFSDCLPCIQEMKQFGYLIAEKSKEIKIISISINSYDEWKKALRSSSKKFSFLSRPISNWEHLVMKSNEDPTFRNDIPGDNIKTLSDRFQSQRFPMYFVLDKTGTIIASPFSAVDFMTDKFSKQNKVLLFLKDNRTWALLNSIIFSAFIEYSGYYWILVLIILTLKQFYRNRRNLKNDSLED